MSRYQKGKTNLDITEARDSEWQWHELGRMQVCISLQTDNHASTPPLSFLQTGCLSCSPANRVKAPKTLFSGTLCQTLNLVNCFAFCYSTSTIANVVYLDRSSQVCQTEHPSFFITPCINAVRYNLLYNKSTTNPHKV